jgi:putative ABC transport system substrate-binding protein
MLLRVDPDIERVLLVHSSGQTSFPGIAEMRDAAPKLGIDLVTVEVATAEEATEAFTSFAPGEIDAVFMPVDAVVKGADAALQELVNRDHIPIVSPSGIRGDSVMSYGPDLRDLGAQMGVMVAKVLNGADPGALPVELPRRQRLALFLVRAEEIGYEFSEEALSLADVVIRE